MDGFIQEKVNKYLNSVCRKCRQHWLKIFFFIDGLEDPFWTSSSPKAEEPVSSALLWVGPGPYYFVITRRQDYSETILDEACISPCLSPQLLYFAAWPQFWD